MATLKEFRDVRLKKLQQLRALGVNPYPAQVNRDHSLAAVHESAGKLKKKRLKLAGQIVAMRGHGGLRFFDIQDASGSLQLLIRSDHLEAAEYAANRLGFEDLDLLDLGDFIAVEGSLTKTKKGELSLEVAAIALLTKSLRPPPSSWSGLKDKETRLRRRYLDTNFNPEVKERFLRRGLFWQLQRDFLNQRGFSEINVPVLEHTTGGADAKPFKTHMDALDEDFYLRISHELPLKRLIGGGYERVYDIGPRFRNEHYTEEHLPEHVAMELYWAYAGWREGMQLVRELITEVARAVWGRDKFEIKGHQVNLNQAWEELDFAELMAEHYKFDVLNTEPKEVQALLKRHKLEVADTANLARGVDKLWKAQRQQISGPAFLVNVPKFMSPLAKASSERPEVTERFQPIIAGTEAGNGWSELNDPLEQLARFKEQQALRAAGDEEAQMLDIDFVEMLEYGMPPTFGYGHSERLFWLLEGVSAREGVPFPQLRREIDSTTKSIYPELF